MSSRRNEYSHEASQQKGNKSLSIQTENEKDKAEFIHTPATTASTATQFSFGTPDVEAHYDNTQLAGKNKLAEEFFPDDFASRIVDATKRPIPIMLSNEIQDADGDKDADADEQLTIVDPKSIEEVCQQETGKKRKIDAQGSDGDIDVDQNSECVDPKRGKEVCEKETEKKRKIHKRKHSLHESHAKLSIINKFYEPEKKKK